MAETKKPKISFNLLYKTATKILIEFVLNVGLGSSYFSKQRTQSSEIYLLQSCKEYNF